MNTTQLLESLTELYAQKDLLSAERRQVEAQAIPNDVAEKLSEINVEFSQKEDALDQRISEIESSVKQGVISDQKTAKGGSLQAVYTQGRITWETKGLEGFMAAHPEIGQFRKVGQPSVSIRKV